MNKTIDDRMTDWYNREADRYDIPDQHRQRFIDHTRETLAAKATRLRFALDDLAEASGKKKLIDWVTRML